MVKYLLILSILLGWLSADEAKIDVILDQTVISEGSSIDGALNITHDPKDVIDLGSVKYEGKKVKVDVTNKIKFGKDLVVESLRFKLPPPPLGLQVISPFSVKVGSVTVQSIPTSLEVKGRIAAPPPTPVSANVHSSAANPSKGIASDVDKKPILQIEAIGPGPGPFYPGQKILVGYRYTFQGNIELSQEVLPLLDQTDITKLGEKQINDTQAGNVSIREITQVIQVSQSGVFDFPKSTVSGYAYLDRGWGPKTYFEPALVSEIPPIKLVVDPFPENKKPPFFSGAIGPFTLTREAIVPPLFKIGDKITYNLVFKGEGELSSLKPINLLCQPGFSGLFSVGDLPPTGETKKGELTFSYEIRPLNFLVNEVPPVYFAYFDPQSIQYKVLKTEPFSYDLKEETRAVKKIDPPTEEVVMTASLKQPTLENFSVQQTYSVAAPPFSSPYVLLLIPASLIGYFLLSTYREAQFAKKSRPLTMKEHLSLLKLAAKDRTFVSKTENFITTYFGKPPYPKPINDYLTRLQQAVFGPQQIDNFEEFYKELELLCTQTGNQN